MGERRVRQENGVEEQEEKLSKGNPDVSAWIISQVE